MAINSNRKGKTGELEAAREIVRLFSVDARRGQQYSGGNESPDIITGIQGVHFEVKRTEKLSVYNAMQQASDDADVDDVPVVLHRRNGEKWLAIVELDDLPALAVYLHLVLMARKVADDET